MLVVHRRIGQRIVIAGGIEITVVGLNKGGVRLAVAAPRETWIARGEVHDAIAEANIAAVACAADAQRNASASEEAPVIREEST